VVLINIRILIALMILTLPALGEPAGSLRGVVLDSLKSPAPSTLVTLQALDGEGQRKTWTDGQGHFAFDKLAPGSYNLAVNTSGFIKEVIEGIRVDDKADIRLGPIVLKISSACPESINVRYAPLESGTAEYSGKVVERRAPETPLTTPLSHVAVSLWPLGGLRPIASARTKKAGEFLFRNIRPGNYHVEASRPGYDSFTIDWISVKAGSRASLPIPLVLTPCLPGSACLIGVLYLPQTCQ
jgi:hypothetical protein